MVDRDTPCVKCADRLLTIEEAERALAEASDFIMRAQVAHPHEFHLAAGAWFSTYGIAGDGLYE
jgi:hypothetical protein